MGPSFAPAQQWRLWPMRKHPNRQPIYPKTYNKNGGGTGRIDGLSIGLSVASAQAAAVISGLLASGRELNAIDADEINKVAWSMATRLVEEDDRQREDSYQQSNGSDPANAFERTGV